jgi:hypothetical protein
MCAPRRAPASKRPKRYFKQVEQTIRQTVPPAELSDILDNIGLPYSGYNIALSDTATIGSFDGEILVSLKPDHASTWNYIRDLRHRLNREFPDLTFFFQPADIVGQILNFGLPAPIDVQVIGPLSNAPPTMRWPARSPPPGANPRRGGRAPAPGRRRPRAALQRRPHARRSAGPHPAGRGQQPADLAQLQHAARAELLDQSAERRGLSHRGADARIPNVPPPNCWARPCTGGAAPSTNCSPTWRSLERGSPLRWSITTTCSRSTMSTPTCRIATSAAWPPKCDRVLDDFRSKLPKGSFFETRGQVETMRTSFIGLGVGMVFAVLLVYFVMVVNFQSWLDPFIILMALPGALSGILLMLFVTQTTINVPS